MRPLTATISALAIVVAAVGCGGPTSSSTSRTDDHHAEHDDEHGHEDEHDHHHHHEAEHRPEDFPDAVRAAGARHADVLEELEEGHVDHVEHEVEELLDVIDWLPEFAADSDMRKAPWDRVHAASIRLRSAYAVVERKLAEGATPTASDVDVAAADAALEELQSLVGTEKGDQR